MSWFSAGDSVSEAAVLAALKVVQDPDLHRDIVSLNFIRNMVIEGSVVSFVFPSPTAGRGAVSSLRTPALVASYTMYV